jgi:hypothetical protein
MPRSNRLSCPRRDANWLGGKFFAHRVSGECHASIDAGGLYFAFVFGTGFVLGIVRTVWVVPHVGTRKAELMEAPIMLVVTIMAARWIVLRLAIPPAPSARLEMGCIALILMFVAEFSLVLWFRKLTIREYFASRDPVAGRSTM